MITSLWSDHDTDIMVICGDRKKQNKRYLISFFKSAITNSEPEMKVCEVIAHLEFRCVPVDSPDDAGADHKALLNDHVSFCLSLSLIEYLFYSPGPADPSTVLVREPRSA